ncbi:MAG: hypothetical protein KC535_03470 [Nanoarchaeota archaeon]|nr:hypothetical protein [Nanoarchaeota archaeon]
MTEPTFLTIGISTWANILVALATFVLALITWLTIRHMKKQMVFIQKQTLLAINEQNPILQVENFKIKENKLSFKIKNIGKGNAHQIGVHARFLLAKPIVKGFDKEKNMHLVNFSYDSTALIDVFDKKKHKVVDNGYVNFISKINSKVVILKPEESVQVELEPDFYLRYPFTFNDSVARVIKFNELLKLFKENGKNFVGFSFDLVCKNSIEDTQDSVEMSKFVFDINNQKTLEDGAKQNYSLNYVALSRDAIELKIGGTGYKEYNSMKSMKNYIPGENDENPFDFFK